MELFDTHLVPSERRAFQRRECDICIPGLGSILNIGLGGVYLEGRGVTENGEIALTFPLEQDRLIITDAKVVNKRSLQGKSGYGLQFINIDVNSRTHILKYLSEQKQDSPIVEDVKTSLDAFVSTWPHQYNLVSPEFKKEIADFRLYLNQLKTTLCLAEKKISLLPPSERSRTCESIIEYYEKELQEKVHCMILAVNEVIKDYTETDHTLHRAYFQEQLLDFTSDSVFFSRAFHKPLGYAGDYMMMEMLYQGLRSGKNLWQKVINSCLTSLPMGQAVRHRAWYLSNKILQCLDTHDCPSIMSLACGPCEEVVIALEKKALQARYYLVDQDKEALQYAQNKLSRIQFRTKARASLNFHEDTVKHFVKAPDEVVNSYPKMDLIYAAGLYDYLQTSVAIKLTRVLWSLLKPGGTILIGNFSRNEFSYFIEYASNWFLIYRSPKDLLEIIPQDIEGVKAEINDPASVQLFLCLQKTNRV